MRGGTSLGRNQFLQITHCVFGTALDTYLYQPPNMRTFPSQAVICYYFNHAHIRRPSQLCQRKLKILLIDYKNTLRRFRAWGESDSFTIRMEVRIPKQLLSRLAGKSVRCILVQC